VCLIYIPIIHETKAGITRKELKIHPARARAVGHQVSVIHTCWDLQVGTFDCELLQAAQYFAKMSIICVSGIFVKPSPLT
jgi:hypothetical protein